MIVTEPDDITFIMLADHGVIILIFLNYSTFNVSKLPHILFEPTANYELLNNKLQVLLFIQEQEVNKPPPKYGFA